jgi:hypothetical protein
LDNISDINGPTLVYSRSAMEWQNSNQPAVCIKEWIDDQAGSIMKFSAPIFSAARIEDLGRVESEMFIVQTPVHLKTNEKEQLEKLIASGKPVMLCGSPANGIDADFLRLVGLSTQDQYPKQDRSDGIINDFNRPLAANILHTFTLHHPYTQNTLDKRTGTEVIYSVCTSPALVRKDNLMIWDAPELVIYTSAGVQRHGIPTDVLLGSASPYALTARLVNEELSKADKFSAYSPDISLPICCGSWTSKSGELTVLLADLEEGLEHSGKEMSSIEMKLPALYSNHTLMNENRGSNTYIIPDNKIRYSLKRGESRLLKFKKY